jgi:hypothetical protein
MRVPGRTGIGLRNEAAAKAVDVIVFEKDLGALRLEREVAVVL